jgi:hypothetical protein
MCVVTVEAIGLHCRRSKQLTAAVCSRSGLRYCRRCRVIMLSHVGRIALTTMYFVVEHSRRFVGDV